MTDLTAAEVLDQVWEFVSDQDNQSMPGHVSIEYLKTELARLRREIEEDGQ